MNSNCSCEYILEYLGVTMSLLRGKIQNVKPKKMTAFTIFDRATQKWLNLFGI